MKQQKIIVQQLKTIRPKNARLVEELMKLLCREKRAIYARLNSEASFSPDEIRLLINHFNLDANQLFVAAKDRPRAEDFIQNLWKNWVTQVDHIRQQESPLVFMTTNTLPFSLAMQFPNLVKYRFYVMLRFYKAFPELQEQAFYPKAAIYDAVDQYCSDLHTAYEQLPSTEIWGEQTFHLAMQQMEQLHEQQLMTTDTFLLLLEELQQLANQCERYAKKGLKSVDTTPLTTHRPTYKLYLNKTFNVNEHTLLSWHQNSIELTHVFHPVYGVAVSRTQKESIIHYCYTLLDEGTLISQTNANVRRSFFRKIHTAIRRRQERSTQPKKKKRYKMVTA